MSEIGKSIYIWEIQEVYGGNVAKIASTLKSAGFQSVILHEVNSFKWRTSARIALVSALKAVGISVYGGAAVYGANPVLEGQQAAAICTDYGLTGFVFDAEAAFDKVSGADSAAAKLIKEFRLKAPIGTLVGWCWWAFYQSKTGTAYHPKNILWAAMAKGYGNADFGIPMMYWSWGDTAIDAVKYLEESFKQWRAITNKPIIPAGRAYIGDGGTPNSAAMIAFEQRARQLGAEGITWWSMQHAINETALPGIWKTLSNMHPFGEIITPIPPILTETAAERQLRLLWEDHPLLHDKA
jgi:hypothetical protein